MEPFLLREGVTYISTVMKTEYLGLSLESPLVVSSSPFTSGIAGVVRCAESGAGAVVLKSIFEEQILNEAFAFENMSSTAYDDAWLYLKRYLGDDYRQGFLDLVSEARDKVRIPIIASINCVGTGDEWIEYASVMEQAGASALELNIFLQPSDAHTSSEKLERRYAQVVRAVTRTVKMPVAVKLPMRLTNVFALANALLGEGARGAVLYNRFFEPDVDIDRMAFVEGSPYSVPSELRNVLRTAAMFSAMLPQLDLAVSTGVHEGADVVKALLCGARAVQVCTAVHNHGFEIIPAMNSFVDRWASDRGFASVEEFRGRLAAADDFLQVSMRVQYMKYFPAYTD